jgi:hypothetical protein
MKRSSLGRDLRSLVEASRHLLFPPVATLEPLPVRPDLATFRHLGKQLLANGSAYTLVTFRYQLLKYYSI